MRLRLNGNQFLILMEIATCGVAFAGINYYFTVLGMGYPSSSGGFETLWPLALFGPCIGIAGYWLVRLVFKLTPQADTEWTTKVVDQRNSEDISNATFSTLFGVLLLAINVAIISYTGAKSKTDGETNAKLAETIVWVENGFFLTLCALAAYGVWIEDVRKQQQRERDLAANERSAQEAAERRTLALRQEDEKRRQLGTKEAKVTARKNLIEFEKIRCKTLQWLAILSGDLDKSSFTVDSVTERFQKLSENLEQDPVGNYADTNSKTVAMLDDMLIKASRRRTEREYDTWHQVIQQRLPAAQFTAMLDSIERTFRLGLDRHQVQESYRELEALIDRLVSEDQPEHQAREETERADYYFRIFDQVMSDGPAEEAQTHES